MARSTFRVAFLGLIIFACRPTDKTEFAADAGAGSAGVDAGPRSDAGIIQLAAGSFHICALLSSGKVRCWGRGEYGALGYGNPFNIGDNEQPWTAGDIDVGGDAGIVQIAAGGAHTCVLFSTGTMKCWGFNYYGQLGYGHTNNVGANAGEYPSTIGMIDVGGDAGVIQIAAGSHHTCALLAGGKIKCWGSGLNGQLGNANTTNIGDNEVPASAGYVSIGGDASVVEIAAGEAHTCARLSNGHVRCWGYGQYGQLGYGNVNNIGDDEIPSTVGDVSVAPDAGIIRIAAGSSHTCAVLSTGTTRCWGRNGWGTGGWGTLGYGHTNNIGDDAGEYPSTAGDISVDPDASVVQVAGGEMHTCALLSTGRVRCWGMGEGGRLGYGNINYIGDNELPSAAGDVDVGGDAGVVQVVAGGSHTCALLATGRARCWGVAIYYGTLGYGNTLPVGYPEPPSAAGDVQVE